MHVENEEKQNSILSTMRSVTRAFLFLLILTMYNILDSVYTYPYFSFMMAQRAFIKLK